MLKGKEQLSETFQGAMGAQREKKKEVSEESVSVEETKDLLGKREELIEEMRKIKKGTPEAKKFFLSLKERIRELGQAPAVREAISEAMEKGEIEKSRYLESLLEEPEEIKEGKAELEPIKTEISEEAFNNIKETNEYLEEKDRKVELDFEKIKENHLELYLDSGYPEALGLSQEEFKQGFDELMEEVFKEISKSEKQDLIKESIEKEGYNDIGILINEIRGKEISRFLHYQLLIEQAKNKKGENLFPNQYIDSDFDGDTNEEKINNIKTLDLNKLDDKLIKALNKTERLEDLLEKQGKKLADITKPRPKIQVCLIKNYREAEKETLNQSAPDLWKELKEKNQSHLLPEAYMLLQRKYLKEKNLEDIEIDERKKLYLDTKYVSWLAGVSADGVSRVDWNPVDLRFWLRVNCPGRRDELQGGRPAVVLFEK